MEAIVVVSVFGGELLLDAFHIFSKEFIGYFVLKLLGEQSHNQLLFSSYCAHQNGLVFVRFDEWRPSQVHDHEENRLFATVEGSPVEDATLALFVVRQIILGPLEQGNHNFDSIFGLDLFNFPLLFVEKQIPNV